MAAEADCVAFDLDGTLLRTPAGVDYDDASQIAALEPIEAAVRRLAALRRRGCKIAVITGRPESARLVTQLQVTVLAGRETRLIMQNAWAGGHVLADYKAAALRQVGARLFVGDSRSDRMAAERAAVPFMTARAFSEGQPMPLAVRAVPVDG